MSDDFSLLHEGMIKETSHEFLNNDHQKRIALIFCIPSNLLDKNQWRPVKRICVLKFGLKGLSTVLLF